MLKFYLNKKFWMPLIILSLLAGILEVAFRYGVWDKMVKPSSYLGNGIYREKAIMDFGLDKIHWITIGDSRTDWGLDHGEILRAQKSNGTNHLRMSFESSNFMAIQATIEWSMANMPNLKGIMLGVAEDNFGHYSDVKKQYKVAWPFKEYVDYSQYSYFHKDYHLLSYVSRSALFVYFSDIKNFAKKISKRFIDINYYMNNENTNIFSYNRKMYGDICDYSLKTINQCIDAAKIIKKKLSPIKGAEKFILNICGTENIAYRAQNNLPYYQMSDNEIKDKLNNWQLLFNKILGNKIALKLVFFPEHSIFEYAIKPGNTNEVVDLIIKNNKNNEFFEVLDLRRFIDSNLKLNQCQLFKDPLHYNNLGKSLITQKIIDSLR